MTADRRGMARARPRGGRTGRGVAWLLLAPILFLALAGALRVHWSSEGRYRIEGDETAYLIGTRSLAEDQTFDLAAGFRAEFADGRATGRVWPAGRTLRERIMAVGGVSIHRGRYVTPHLPGLSAVAVAPWLLAGTPGVRAALAVLAASLAAIPYLLARRAGARRGLAAASAVALTCSMPFLVAATQVYPDLPAGVILAWAITVSLLGASGWSPPRRAWVACSVAVVAALCLLPWFHLRFVAAGAVVVLLVAHEISRRARHRRTLFSVVVASYLGSVVALAVYDLWAYGDASGPYTKGAAELGTTATMVFLGLQFDRFHGLFVMAPLLLLAGVGLVVAWRRRQGRLAALAVAATYLTLIAPAAIHTNWYGGYSFAGRFGWAAAAVLVPPAALGVVAVARRNRPVALAIVGAGAAYQALNYTRAWRGTIVLYNQDPRVPLGAYESWLPALWRSTPALYDSRWAFRYAPNLLGIAALLTLLVAPAVALGRDRTRARAATLAIGLALVVLVVPAASASGPWSRSRTVAARLDSTTGRTRGASRTARPGRDAAGTLGAGRAIRLTAGGPLRGVFDVDVGAPMAGPAAPGTVDLAVWTDGTRPASVCRSELPNRAGRYRVTLAWTAPQAYSRAVELRTTFAATRVLTLHDVALVADRRGRTAVGRCDVAWRRDRPR